MGKTNIEWAQNPDGSAGRTWNVIRARNLETGGVGHYCEKVSPGCANCYAARMQPRFKNKIRYNAADRDKVELFLDEDVLREPLRWRKPQNVFVCSMTDLFGGFVPDEWIDRIFAVMSLTPQHTYDVLTKRAVRAYHYLGRSEAEQDERRDAIGEAGHADHEIIFSGAPDCSEGFHYLDWPLPNVRLGVSVENQDEADKRAPVLLQTPAAGRWLSCEPLLGPLDLTDINPARDETPDHLDALRGIVRTSYPTKPTEAKLDWVIVGGESGPGARPMHPDWARSLRDQCQRAGVPFFFKQWGEYVPLESYSDFQGNLYYNDKWVRPGVYREHCFTEDWYAYGPDDGKMTVTTAKVLRVGKKEAGRLLDGREWNDFPSTTHTA